MESNWLVRGKLAASHMSTPIAIVLIIDIAAHLIGTYLHLKTVGSLGK